MASFMIERCSMCECLGPLPPVRREELGEAAPDLRASMQMVACFYPATGELDVTFTAWLWPTGEEIVRTEWTHYDSHHVGMAAPDMVARIFEGIQLLPEPF